MHNNNALSFCRENFRFHKHKYLNSAFKAIHRVSQNKQQKYIVFAFIFVPISRDDKVVNKYTFCEK